MPGFPSDEAIPLDGTVGRLDDLETPAPFTSPSESPLLAFVSGDAASRPGAMGLAEDVGLLIQEFLRCRESGARRSAPKPADEHADVQIALHGLNLDADEEARLHNLIRKLVRERVEGKEASE